MQGFPDLGQVSQGKFVYAQYIWHDEQWTIKNIFSAKIMYNVINI